MKIKTRIEELKRGIGRLAQSLGPVTIMEVCGTHTASIHRYGIQELLPDQIRLVSGPGCPVCVTAPRDLAAALAIAKQDNVIFTCFGDLMRVPCGEESLYSLYENGKEIRIVTSPLDALAIAQENPDQQTVFFAIGFETTAPLTAALIEAAAEGRVENLSVYSAHKTMPQALRELLQNGSRIDALLCPGHVAAIIGAKAFSFVPEELALPAAVAGFRADEIMAALFIILEMLCQGEKKCVNMYPQIVTEDGNKEALALLDKVFAPCDALWRGLGEIEGSGLGIRERFRDFDAAQRFDLLVMESEEPKGCLCRSILQGRNIPTDCVNFGQACTPQQPLGACMVSSEGSCATYYRYQRDRGE
ncbi:MAG: hydrogenase formation protein HypD [Firmicutes bacterium]|nr:hydrogenase formation protein HypD [Bacillota bacterium]